MKLSVIAEIRAYLWALTLLAVFVIGDSTLADSGQQSPTPQLETAISAVRNGDHLRGVMMLNDLVVQLEGLELARAHAYRAAAYNGLDQPERAAAAAILALQA